MEILHPFLLLLAGLSGSFAKEDLQKKSFIFPMASNTAHVSLNVTPQHPLTGFTLCLRYYTDLTRPYSLFSYATRQNDNELLLYVTKPNQFSLYLGGDSVSFSLPEDYRMRVGGDQICVSWESATGIVQFSVNGMPFPRKGLKKGYAISPKAAVILGQEQDTFGGGFDMNQCLVGEISNVYMWEQVLTTDEVTPGTNYDAIPNPMIDWKSLDYDAEGYVVVKPSAYLWYLPN